MTSILRTCIAALFAAIFAIAAPALAQTEVKNPPDPYIHKAVGIAFPARLTEFVRSRVVEYSEDGADASVGYGALGIPGEMTLYVYPGDEDTCNAWFQGADAAVTKRSGTARRPAAPALKLLPRAPLEAQQSATYTVPPGGYGFDHPELVSYLWVGCLAGPKAGANRWVVKYRGSFFATDEAKAAALAERLFAAIDWSPLTGK
jgi:hypothetical protein